MTSVRIAWLASVLLALCGSSVSVAQQAAINVVVPQTEYPRQDENGVDLSTGGREVYGPTLQIGDPANGGLTFTPVIAGRSANFINPAVGPANLGDLVFYGLAGTSNLSSSLTLGGTLYETMKANPATVVVDGKVARFSAPLGPPTYSEFTPVIGRTLTFSSTPLLSNIAFETDAFASTSFVNAGTYILQDSDGSRYYFSFQPNIYSSKLCNYPCSFSLPIGRIERPNGDVVDFYYSSSQSVPATNYGSTDRRYTLRAVVSNRGYMIKFQRGAFTMAGVNYATTAGTGTSGVPATWDGSSSAVAVNLAQESCNPFAASCSFSRRWPMLSVDPNRTQSLSATVNGVAQVVGSVGYVVGPDGAQTAVTINSIKTSTGQPDIVVARPNGRTESFRWRENVPLPTAAGSGPFFSMCNDLYTAYAAIVTVPCPFAPLQSYSDGAATWTYATSYSAAPAGNGQNYIATTVTRTDPLGRTRTTVAIPSGQITSDADELGRTTKVATVNPFSTNEGRALSLTFPKGNSRAFTYDARGNVTLVTETPVQGSSLSARTTRYDYPTACDNPRTCNRPTAITDALGNSTNYTWDASSGQLLTQTSPAVTVSGGTTLVNPVTTNIYAQRYAWVSNAAGGYQRAASPVWLLTQTATCRSSAAVNGSCAAGAADQTVTSFYYGPDSGPNNLALRGVSIASNGAVRTTCYGYDVFGNRISETRPNANPGAGATVCP